MVYRIYQIKIDKYKGSVGFSSFPGRQEVNGKVILSKSKLAEDLGKLKKFKPVMVISLIEAHEVEAGYLNKIQTFCSSIGADWVHLPIADYSIPDTVFENGWLEHIQTLLRIIESSHNIFFHCKGGLGRSGLVAAKLLKNFGFENNTSIEMVRNARAGAVETVEQENYIRDL